MIDEETGQLKAFRTHHDELVETYRDQLKNCTVRERMLWQIGFDYAMSAAQEEVSHISTTYEKSHREWETRLEDLQEKCNEQRYTLSEYRQELAFLRKEEGL